MKTFVEKENLKLDWNETLNVSFIKNYSLKFLCLGCHDTLVMVKLYAYLVFYDRYLPVNCPTLVSLLYDKRTFSFLLLHQRTIFSYANAYQLQDTQLYFNLQQIQNLELSPE